MVCLTVSTDLTVTVVTLTVAVINCDCEQNNVSKVNSSEAHLCNQNSVAGTVDGDNGDLINWLVGQTLVIASN
jgi:hypothetical protein